jgi:hypothetical protein
MTLNPSRSTVEKLDQTETEAERESEAMSQQKSKYAAVSTAKAQRGANYVRPGHYLARIDAVREDKSSNKKGDFIAIELTIAKVLDATNTGPESVKQTPHVVGETAADILMLANIAFEGRAKAFAMAAGGLNESDFAQEEYPGQVIEQMVSPDQPLAGRLIEFRAAMVVKRDSRQKDSVGPNDVYTRIDYIRRVPADEVPTVLGPDVTAKFFPDLVVAK